MRNNALSDAYFVLFIEHWSGFFTPEYMLKRTSSLDHSIFRYDSSWNLQRNADKLTMDLQASVKPKVCSQHIWFIATNNLHLEIKGTITDKIHLLYCFFWGGGGLRRFC